MNAFRTTQGAIRVRNMLERFTEYYVAGRGTPPARIVLTPKQLGRLGVGAGHRWNQTVLVSSAPVFGSLLETHVDIHNLEEQHTS